MYEDLIKGDFDFLLTTPNFTKINFEYYQDYTSYKYKQKQLDRVEQVMANVKKIEKGLDRLITNHV